MYPPSFSQHPLAAEIDLARHHNFMKLALPHLISGLFTAGIIYLMYRDFAMEHGPILWFGANIILLLSTVIFYTIYHLRPQWLSIPAWGKVTFAVAALWGLCWALPPFILLDTQQTLYIGIMVAFMVAMSSVPAPVMVHYPASYVVFISLPLGSLCLKAMLSDIEGKEVIQFLTPFLWISLLLYGWDLHKTVIESIRLRLEHKNAQKEAEQANIAKSKFIAAASHDIRQPLQAATLFLSALKNQSTTAHTQDITQRLEKSIDGMSDLLNSLLDMSKLDAQVIEITPEHYAVQALFERLSTEHSAIAAHHGLDIKFQAQPLTLYCDVILLERVLNNLISNGIRYTKKGTVTIQAEQQGKQVQFKVTDTGVGIPQPAIEHIFDEFYQLENPEQERQKGLGLGLSIVKRLCELQSWSLSVTSDSGKGSQFTVSVPLGLQENIQAKPKLELQNLSHITAIIIDDNKDIREGLKHLLNQWHCRVMVATSGEEALSMLNTQQIKVNLIISDFRLAENKNGLDAINMVQAESQRKIQSILLTGDTAPSELYDISQSGITLLHKPVKPGKLRAVLQKKFSPFMSKATTQETTNKTQEHSISDTPSLNP